MVKLFDLRWPMVTYILLVIADLTITYIGVAHLRMVEGSRIINYYGVELGIVVVFLWSMIIAYVLWILRNTKLFRWATMLAIWMLCIIELAAVVNNLVLMY